MSAASFLEIVELPSGEVVLRRTDSSEGNNEPLLTITFSAEAKGFLGENLGEVGRAMVGAGIQLVGQLYAKNEPAEDEHPTLH